jgi:hypothetical protein
MPLLKAFATGYAGAKSMYTDINGNFYIVSTNKITKITPTGVVTLDWAVVNNIIDIFIDTSGNVFAINGSDTRIAKFPPSSYGTPFWVTLAVAPLAITGDAYGTIYTLNADQTVSKITSAGVVTQTWVTLTGLSLISTILSATSGYVYIGSLGWFSVINPLGDFTAHYAAMGGGLPKYMATDYPRRSIFAYTGSGIISKVTSSGEATTTFATLSEAAYDLVSDNFGNLYTPNKDAHTISKIASDGTVTQTYIDTGTGTTPTALTVDRSNNLYVANASIATISEIVERMSISAML